MNQTKLTVLNIFLAIALASCGGGDDSSGETCEAFTACGGDLVGTWTVEDVCLMETHSDKDCPAGIVLDGRGMKAKGTVTYKADKSLTNDVELSGTMVIHVPTTCLSGFTCDQFGTGLMADLMPGMDDVVSSITCKAESQGCACTATVADSIKNSGTYAISGNTVTETITSDASGDPPEVSDYCVSGNVLRTKPATTSNSMEDILMGTIRMKKK